MDGSAAMVNQIWNTSVLSLLWPPLSGFPKDSDQKVARSSVCGSHLYQVVKRNQPTLAIPLMVEPSVPKCVAPLPSFDDILVDLPLMDGHIEYAPSSRKTLCMNRRVVGQKRYSLAQRKSRNKLR
jgi:hypothetical protein